MKWPHTPSVYTYCIYAKNVRARQACLQSDSGSLPLERRFNIVHARINRREERNEPAKRSAAHTGERDEKKPKHMCARDTAHATGVDTPVKYRSSARATTHRTREPARDVIVAAESTLGCARCSVLLSGAGAGCALCALV